MWNLVDDYVFCLLVYLGTQHTSCYLDVNKALVYI